jgi:hypothetical protein
VTAATRVVITSFTVALIRSRPFPWAHRTGKDPASASRGFRLRGERRPFCPRAEVAVSPRPTGILPGRTSTPRNARAAQRPRSRNGMTLSQTSGYGQTLNPAAFAAGRPGSSPERRTGRSRAGAAAGYGEVQEAGGPLHAGNGYAPQTDVVDRVAELGFDVDDPVHRAHGPQRGG